MSIGPKPDLVITETSILFQTYLTKSEVFLAVYLVRKDEFKIAFDFLRCHKATGSDEIHVKTIKSVQDEMNTSLLHVFNTAIKYGVVPVQLKIAKVSPIFKSANQEIMMNYTSIAVLL